MTLYGLDLVALKAWKGTVYRWDSGPVKAPFLCYNRT
jgi:hypothetical protein